MDQWKEIAAKPSVKLLLGAVGVYIAYLQLSVLNEKMYAGRYIDIPIPIPRTNTPTPHTSSNMRISCSSSLPFSASHTPWSQLR
jgi:hypothetical protein